MLFQLAGFRNALKRALERPGHVKIPAWIEYPDGFSVVCSRSFKARCPTRAGYVQKRTPSNSAAKSFATIRRACASSSGRIETRTSIPCGCLLRYNYAIDEPPSGRSAVAWQIESNKRATRAPCASAKLRRVVGVMMSAEVDSR